TRGDTDVSDGNGVGNGMWTNAKASWTAATLLVLGAACGSGRQPGLQKVSRGVQASTGLQGENGLSPVTITASCLTMDGMTGPTATAAPDPTLATDPSVVDPTLLTDPTRDPSLDVSTGVTLDPTVADPMVVQVAACGDMLNGLPPNLLGDIGLSKNAFKTDQFQKWFNADPAAAGLLMKYLVRCS